MPALDRTTLQEEDIRDPKWRTRTGPPARWMDFDGDHTITSPIAPSTPFTVGYLAGPTPMAVIATDSPDSRIPDVHQPHLALAALYLLLSKDGDQKTPAGANRALSDFYTLIGVAKPVGAGNGGSQNVSRG